MLNYWVVTMSKYSMETLVPEDCPLIPSQTVHSKGTGCDSGVTMGNISLRVTARSPLRWTLEAATRLTEHCV